MLQEELIRVARGEAEAELILRNARVVDVFSGDVFAADVAIAHSYIAGLGEYRARNEIDLAGRTFARLYRRARAHRKQHAGRARVRPCRRTSGHHHRHRRPARDCQRHGLAGVRYWRRASTTLSVYVMAPSAVHRQTWRRPAPSSPPGMPPSHRTSGSWAWRR